jgi:dienelactone hydrolase
VTHVVLFHHAQGLTEGVRAFADRLSDAGHTVTLPDLYDGRTFATLDAGVAHAESIGMREVVVLGEEAVADLPEDVVYAGFSLGALPAQDLAQTRPGALGAILYHGAVPAAVFGGPWPASVRLQLHIAEQDPWCELDVAQDLAGSAGEGELFVYPGSAHLVADSSLAEYDPALADLIVDRSLALLAQLDVRRLGDGWS